jgi:hypothetical protein
MTNTVKISCILNTTNADAPLGFEAWVDNDKFVDIDHVKDEQQIQFEIADDDGEHELIFVLKNKKPSDTKVDKDGTIISDATLIIDNLLFDEIPLGYKFTELAVYNHDANGTQAPIKDTFYNVMGCNGTVNLKFSTPIYLWLLEHM